MLATHPFGRGTIHGAGRRFLAGTLVVLAALMPSCAEDPQAPAPDATPNAQHTGIYDAGNGTLEFAVEGPDGGLSTFRLVSTGIVLEPGVVRTWVALRNTSGVPLLGPARITVSDFVPADVLPQNAACIERECANCPAVCSFDHGGTYGEDGMLEPGETSEPVQWVFSNPAGESFAFRARFDPEQPQPGAGLIAGTVFGDLNADGRRQAGEPGIGGQNLSLVFDGAVQSTQTDDRGRYAFRVVEAGLYELIWNRRDPGGCQPTTPTRVQVLILRRPDGTLSGFAGGDFGCAVNALPAVPVGGVVFADDNRNGVHDPGEAGLQGILVVGAAPNCPTFAAIEARTDERGRYKMQLPNCAPPFVVHREAIPGTVDTSPNPVVFMHTPPESLLLVANFGVAREDSSQQGLAVQGVVFLDANRNGVRERGEIGLAGVEVSAAGLECLIPVIGITRTDENGHYRLRSTDVHCPLPWVVQRYGEGIDTTPNPVFLHRPPPDGSTTFVVDFGVARPDSLPPPGPAIAGLVFADWNRDGVRDRGEPGIPGVELQLQSPCRVLRATRTDLDGRYSFFPAEVALCPVTAVWQSAPVFPEHTTPNPLPVDPAAGAVVLEANFGVIPGRMQP